MEYIGLQLISKNNQVISSLNLREDENAVLAGTVTIEDTVSIPSGATLVIV